MANREGIANITHGSICRTKIVGRDDTGKKQEEQICARGHVLMIDLDGVELKIPVQNARVATKLSLEKYGKPHLRECIRTGFIPKWECPLTTKYSDLVGGSGALVTFGDDDFEKVAREECEIDPERPPLHGCEHYQLVKAKRRERTAEEAIVRKEPLRRGDKPTAAILELAQSFKEMANSDHRDLKKRRKRASKAAAAGLEVPSE